MSIVPSDRTSWTAPLGLNTLRLAYSGVRPDEISEGIGRLAEAYRSLSVAAA